MRTKQTVGNPLAQVVALVLLMLLLAAESLAAQHNPPNTAPETLGRLEVCRQENFFQKQLRLFRTYPHLERAYRLMDEGRLDEARLELERYLEIDPQDLRVRFMYLLLLQRTGDAEEAIRQADLILEQQPGFAPARVYRGLACQALGRFDEATEAFRAAAATADPGTEEGNFTLEMLADLALQAGQYSHALEALRQLAETRERDYRFHFREGIAREALGQLEQAESAYRLALGLAEDPKQKLKVYRALGETAKKRKDWQAARKAFESALELGPGDADLMQALAQVAYAQGDYSEAARWMRRSLEQQPDPGKREFLANVLIAMNEDAAAAEQLVQLLSELDAAQDRHRVLLLLGEVYTRLDNYPEATRAFQEAARLHQPDHATVHALAHALEREGRLAEALPWFEKRLRLQPSATAHLELGMIYAKLGQGEQATQHLHEALKAGLPQEQQCLAYKQLGFLCQQAGRYREARQAFEKALGLRPRETSLYLALGEVCIQQGDLDSAVRYLEHALGLQETPEAFRALAHAHIKAGNLEQAITTCQEYLRKLPERQMAAPDILETLAFLKAERGNWIEAAALYQEAFERGGQANPMLLRQAAYCLATAGQWEEARQVYLRFLASPGLPKSLKGATWEDLGYIELRLNRHPQAVEAFQKALDFGRDTWRLRQDLALTLYRLERWEEALEQFRLALDRKRTTGGLAAIGRCYKALNKPGVAIHFFRLALEESETLEADERRQLYNELGYLYAREAEYAESAWAWQQSLVLKDDPAVRLHLGRMQRLQGSLEEARETLAGISLEGLPPELQAAYLDELAEIDRSDGLLESAREEMAKAYAIEPTADRAYRLSLICRELNRPVEEVAYAEEALRREPDNIEYAVTLGYACSDAGQTQRAALLLEDAVERDPGCLPLYEDLAYLYMKQPDNEQAVYWFKRAIDNATPSLAGLPEEEKELEQHLYRMRKEVATLNNRWDITAYLSYRTDAEQQVTTPVGTSGGGVSSQGGLEVAYQPPEIGFRDGRIFQLFARVLWNVEPDSLRFDEDSYQGGIGARYKPFKRHNLFFSGEKLFRIGDDADDNWLLRALYTWDDGYALKPGEEHWNYTLLYGDAAYFVDSPDYWTYYGEVRQGRTFNFDDCFLVTPHLVADGRYQDRGSATGSYIEGGAGVSFRYLFNNTRYEVYRSSFEVLVHYKAGRFYRHTSEIEDDTFNGAIITGVLRF